MNFRTPIVAYEEKGKQVSIFSTQPCVIVRVEGIELGPFYENMEAARKAATKHIDGIIKSEAEEKAKKGKKRA